MINFDDYVNENKNEHNENTWHTPDKSYRIPMIGGSGSGQTNVLLKICMKQNFNIYLIKEKVLA